jgi:CheY-like chemotaxis protein
VTSKLGEGTTFTVCNPLTLAAEQPVAEPQSTLAEALDAAIHNRERPLVLLVEDYEPNVLVARSFLEEFGYRVEVATNGLEAFEMVKAGDFAVALMDVQMHGLNGLDATRMIREHEKQRDRKRLPIIGMTAHALAGDRERCLAVGMDDYVAKPFNPAELQAKMKTLVKGTTV